MEQHSQDLLVLMTWAFSTLGALVVGVAGWGIVKVLGRLDAQDSTLQAIRDLLSGTEGKLVEMIHQHEIRLTKIESQCSMIHGGAMRRHDDYHAFPDYPE